MVIQSLENSFEDNESSENSPLKKLEKSTEFFTEFKESLSKAFKIESSLDAFEIWEKNSEPVEEPVESPEVLYQKHKLVIEELNKNLYTFYSSLENEETENENFKTSAPKVHSEVFEEKNLPSGNLRSILDLMKDETFDIKASKEYDVSSRELKVMHRKPETKMFVYRLEDFNVNKRKEILRYTVDEDFFDDWCFKSKMDEDKMNNILMLWASDNWEGLYDPPVWLTGEMFCRALNDEMSNIIKSNKKKEAKINLEIARLTSTKFMPDILKNGAMEYLENMMQMTDLDSNDNFTEEKSLAIFMHVIYKNMEDMYMEQNLKFFRLKNDLKEICENAVQEWRNMTEFYEKSSRSYAQYIKFLQDLRGK